jgi:hypothetical protein
MSLDEVEKIMGKGHLEVSAQPRLTDRQPRKGD